MYLLTVELHYCVMHFAYVLHMRQQNLVLDSRTTLRYSAGCDADSSTVSMTAFDSTHEHEGVLCATRD